jgi:rod shape determining protein RodA
MGKIFFYLKNLDWSLFFAILLLASFGLTEIYSIALGQETTDLLNFKKQIFFILIGIVCFFIFAILDHDFWKNFSRYFYVLTITILIGVLFLGQVVRGTRGWFFIGPFGIQPVEFAKIILIISLAYFFSYHAIKIRSFKQLLSSGLLVAGLAIPIFLQPDFGSAVLLLAIWFLLLLFAGFNKKYFVTIILTVVLVVGGLWSFYFKDYQKERILTFLDPTANVLSSGYNVNQALIAVGSGGLLGRGVGFGSQSQLKFLPEAENDFIFAVVCEEFGFLGAGLIFLAYLLIFFRCLVAARKTSNDFGTFFILGAAGLIFIEMFINISMNLGIMPVVGISLPFLSYGGSSIISSFILMGIVENIIIKYPHSNAVAAATNDNPIFTNNPININPKNICCPLSASNIFCV